MTYVQGHVKRNPVTGEVGLRTQFPEGINAQLDAMAWLIATPTQGSRHATTDEVTSWDDLFEAVSE